jgi:hypothetical protein
LVHFVFIWNISSRFGIMYQENSGNPGARPPRPPALACKLAGGTPPLAFLSNGRTILQVVRLKWFLANETKIAKSLRFRAKKKAVRARQQTRDLLIVRLFSQHSSGWAL